MEKNNTSSDISQLVPDIPLENIAASSARIAEIFTIKYHPRVMADDMFRIIAGFRYAVESSDSNELLWSRDFTHKKLFISTNPRVLGTPEWRFAIAREIAHMWLHNKYFGNISIHENLQVLSESIFPSKEYKRAEMQADCFASHLLMPDNLFYQQYRKAHEKIGMPMKNYPRIFVDTQEVNIRDFESVVSRVAHAFGVPEKTVIKRLNSHDLIRGSMRPVSLNIFDYIFS